MAFNAGFTSFRAKDNDGAVPCALWYPTHEAPQVFKHGVYDFNVAKNAQACDGPLPLVMMSHGSGGTRFGHCKTAEFLAQHGYGVLATEHPFNNFFDDSGAGSAKTYQNRSRHMKSALDALLNDDTWGPFIDPDRIAIFGFSLGGFTALTCVGAKPYVDGLRHHIRANREFDPTFCGYEVIVRDGFDAPYMPITPDPRYKACIALAPVSGGLFPKESLQDISVPLQIWRAEHDMVLRNPFHADEIKNNLPQGCDYHITKKAGHFSYLSPVRDDVKQTLGELANDNPGFDRKAAHQDMHGKILTFLEGSLA